MSTNLDKLWTPTRNLRKIKIMPSTDPSELTWKCAECKNVNEMKKSDVSDNRSYSCWNCRYTWTIGAIPDDIRHFLEDRNQDSNIDYRPRIVR